MLAFSVWHAFSHFGHLSGWVKSKSGLPGRRVPCPGSGIDGLNVPVSGLHCVAFIVTSQRPEMQKGRPRPAIYTDRELPSSLSGVYRARLRAVKHEIPPAVYGPDAMQRQTCRGALHRPKMIRDRYRYFYRQVRFVQRALEKAGVFCEVGAHHFRFRMFREPCVHRFCYRLVLVLRVMPVGKLFDLNHSSTSSSCPESPCYVCRTNSDELP